MLWKLICCATCGFDLTQALVVLLAFAYDHTDTLVYGHIASY